ncbi:DUF5691 domain-containing protein, partial [Baaleninema sp.]|uniref:DUF5691 domain-containing protein n=1 Tax=Baaleninema sp. TaxID=3101197 RepID=UPI003D03A0BF
PRNLPAYPERVAGIGCQRTMWQDLVKAALLGTRRQSPQLPPQSPRLENLLDRADEERQIYRGAAIEALRRRAGQRFEKVEGEAIDPAPEERLRYSPAAGRLLRQILDRSDGSELLPQWVGCATEAGVCVPPEQLPALLDLAVSRRHLRSAILGVIGARGRWLAAQNPDWEEMAGTSPTEDIHRQWRLGTSATRLVLLQRLRETQPEKAREFVESTWQQDKAFDRSEFLKTFAVGLSDADEPFLETALDDKSKQVRAVAADLLARLPHSGLCRRVTERVEKMLSLSKRGKSVKLRVTLPTALDAAAKRDGINSKKPTKIGEKAWWFLQQLAMVPPTRWTTSATPNTLVKAALESEWAGVLLEGWAVATTRHPDADWAEALLEVVDEIPEKSIDRCDRDRALADCLSLERLETFVSNHLAAHPEPLLKSHPSLALLKTCRHPWRDDFTRQVIDRFCGEIQTAKDNYNWSVRSTFQSFAYFISPHLFDEISQKLKAVTPPGSYWEQTVDDVLDILKIRQELQKI